MFLFNPKKNAVPAVPFPSEWYIIEKNRFMGNQRIPFEQNTYYHLYNHGNANDNLFREDENYWFFLKKYQKYVQPIADTFAYCLMPNHFHFLIRTQPKEIIKENLLFGVNSPPAQIERWIKALELDYNKYLSFQLSNFFNSYSKSFNNKYQRKGSLFLPNVSRKAVDSLGYKLYLVCYIHCNPIHHDFISQVEDWPYSSYETVLRDLDSWLENEAVMKWFGNQETYTLYHKAFLDKKGD